MTQQPFSRPGAIDLSGLGQPPPPQQAPRRRRRAGRRPAAGRRTASRWTSRTSRGLLEQSMTAPVLLVFYSAHPDARERAAGRRPRRRWSGEHEGRYLPALVDVDAAPADRPGHADPVDPARRWPSSTAGRCRSIQDAAADRGAAHRAAPRSASSSPPRASPAATSPARAPPRPTEGEEEVVDPRYAPAQDALAAGDIDAAVAEYQKLRRRQPGRRRGGRRPRDRQGHAAHPGRRPRRRPGPPRRTTPTTSTRRPWSPTSTCSAGTSRTPSPGWSTSSPARRDKDREKARDHLLGLFAAVGNDDPRVLAGRRNLASALF